MNVAVTAFLKVLHNLVRTEMYWFWEVKLNFYTIILKSAAGRSLPITGLGCNTYYVAPELNIQHNLNQQAHNKTNNIEW